MPRILRDSCREFCVVMPRIAREGDDPDFAGGGMGKAAWHWGFCDMTWSGREPLQSHLPYAFGQGQQVVSPDLVRVGLQVLRAVRMFASTYTRSIPA